MHQEPNESAEYTVPAFVLVLFLFMFTQPQVFPCSVSDSTQQVFHQHCVLDNEPYTNLVL
jgi:hypothetical protein